MSKTRLGVAVAIASVLLLTAMPANAEFDEAPFLVGTDTAGDAPIDPELRAAGVDITALFIHRPDFTKPEIQFIIQLAELNAPPPPEGVRYFWSFLINGVEYFIQAKMTDIATIAAVDDPVGAVTHLQGSFRLRGNCGVVGNLNVCPHLKWIDGDFDTELNQVRIRVPLNDPVAPAIAPGAVITQGDVQAGFQAVVSFTATTDQAQTFEDYTISGP